MDKLNIICVDDQREVLSAVLKDLEPLSHCLQLKIASLAMKPSSSWMNWMLRANMWRWWYLIM